MTANGISLAEGNFEMQGKSARQAQRRLKLCRLLQAELLKVEPWK